MAHRTPDGVLQNLFDEDMSELEAKYLSEPDYEYDASVKLMWAKTDYYNSMLNLIDEKIVTEKLKQKLLVKKIDRFDS